MVKYLKKQVSLSSFSVKLRKNFKKSYFRSVSSLFGIGFGIGLGVGFIFLLGY